MTQSETTERRPPVDAQAALPGGVPTKFDHEGRVQHFPGNTIICHLPQDSALHTALLSLSRELEAERPDTLYTLLPPSSWHMTVFEGVCDQVRVPGFWPAGLAMDAKLDDCNRRYAERLKAFEMDITPSFRMQVQGYLPLVDGIGLELEPVTSKQDNDLRTLRDRLSEILGIRQPSHDTYGFHLSIGYFIRFPSDEEHNWLYDKLVAHLAGMPRDFELGAPEFCFFDSMFEFRRQFYLK